MNNLSSFNFKDPLNIFMICAIVTAIAIGGYSWFSLFEEIRLEAKTLEKSVQKNQKKILKLEEQQRQEKVLDKKLKEAELKLNDLQKMFPDAEDVSKRLRDLYAVFRKTDIQVKSFLPNGKDAGPPKKKDGKIDWDKPEAYYEENYYELSLEGGFHNFGQFFAELANFEYPTKLDAMGITVLSSLKQNVERSMITGQEPKTITVKMKLTTFNSRKDSKPDSKADDKAKKSKKSKKKKGKK